MPCQLSLVYTELKWLLRVPKWIHSQAYLVMVGIEAGTAGIENTCSTTELWPVSSNESYF